MLLQDQWLVQETFNLRVWVRVPAGVQKLYSPLQVNRLNQRTLNPRLWVRTPVEAQEIFDIHRGVRETRKSYVVSRRKENSHQAPCLDQFNDSSSKICVIWGRGRGGQCGGLKIRRCWFDSSRPHVKGCSVCFISFLSKCSNLDVRTKHENYFYIVAE